MINKMVNKLAKLRRHSRVREAPLQLVPTFIKHCFYGIFDPFLPKITEKFTEKIPTFGAGVPLRIWLKEGGKV